NRLLQSSDTKVSKNAEELFKDISIEDRKEVIIKYHSAVTEKGNAQKGKEVFQTVCSRCHRLEGVGVSLGPDLKSVTNQTKIRLLTMILDPGLDIAAGYEGYNVETKNGDTYAGIVERENNDNMTIKIPGGA